MNDKTHHRAFAPAGYLTKGVRINIIDRRPKAPLFYGFYFEGGVLSFVKFLAQKKNPLHEDIFYVEKEHQKSISSARSCTWTIRVRRK